MTIKATKNLAKQVEANPQGQVDIKSMPDLKLAELQGGEYQRVIQAQSIISQAQNNINVIQQEIQRRNGRTTSERQGNSPDDKVSGS